MFVYEVHRSHGVKLPPPAVPEFATPAAAPRPTPAHLHAILTPTAPDPQPAAPPAPDPSAPPRSMAHPREQVWLPDLPSRLSVHEAAHATVARRLGLVVERVSVKGDVGVTAIRHGRDPDDLASLAVAAAAAPVLLATFRQSIHDCVDDFDHVATTARAYTAATGKPLDVWALARRVVRAPKVGDQILTVAAALDAHRELDAADLDQILTAFDPPAPVAGPSDDPAPDADPDQDQDSDGPTHDLGDPARADPEYAYGSPD